MVNDPSYYQAQGQDYAAGLAASQNPFIDLFRNRLGSMRSREDLAREISGLYDPAIQSARSLGSNVAGVGAAGLSALTGLTSALPGAGVEGLSEAYRSAGRAGASASMVGSALETGARQGLAESILGRQFEQEQERFGTEDRLAGAESEKARLGADWLGAAQGFQGMGSQYLQDVATDQTTRFQAERQPLELEQLRADIAGIMANTELTQEQKLSMIQQRELDAQFSPREREAGIGQTQQQTKQIKAQTSQIVKETKSMPKPAAARRLAQLMASGQITQLSLQNAQLMSELRRTGYSVKRGSGGKVTVTGPDGKVIPLQSVTG
jgi:hypothetical protein